LKHSVTHFKNLQLALKELKPFILNGEHLQTGKPFESFGGLRSREILANWLLCVAVAPDLLDFSNDPQGGDGIIIDKATGETWKTEHIIVTNREPDKPIAKRILEAIEKKQTKGAAAYASGKTLIVFLNAGGGKWRPFEVAQQLPQKLDFDAVWVVGLQGVVDERYIYAVTRLDLSCGHPPVWKVHINSDFESWTVE
jgi:hypothetical protein